VVDVAQAVRFDAGDYWAPANDTDPDPFLQITDGYQLLPVVRSEAIDWSADASYDAGFPVVRRSALALHANLCARFAAW
jgi:hypothetical protein